MSEELLVKGRVIKFGDNIDTDVILPGKYLVLTEPEELAKHVMEGIDPEFHEKVKDRCIIVAGRNFGCGSSREHAPLALKHSGVKAILAESFARIFYRNCINIGLLAIECKGVSSEVSDGDLIEISVEECVVKDLTKGKRLVFKSFSPIVLEILRSGGLIPYLRKRIGGELA